MLQEALDNLPRLAVEIVDRVNSATPPAQVPTVNEENTSWFPALGSSVRSTHTYTQSATELQTYSKNDSDTGFPQTKNQLFNAVAVH